MNDHDNLENIEIGHSLDAVSEKIDTDLDIELKNHPQVEDLHDGQIEEFELEKIVDISQIDRIQDELNVKLDALADRIDNVVSLYVAVRKKESGEISVDDPLESTEAA